MIPDVESQMLYKKVIRYKSIFAKLNLYGYAVFYKIGLIIAENRDLVCRFDFFLLVFRTQ